MIQTDELCRPLAPSGLVLGYNHGGGKKKFLDTFNRATASQREAQGGGGGASKPASVSVSHAAAPSAGSAPSPTVAAPVANADGAQPIRPKKRNTFLSGKGSTSQPYGEETILGAGS